MKAIYKIRAVDRVMELIQKAKRENRAIDYVMVTGDEYCELHMYHSMNYYVEPCSKDFSASASCKTITLENPCSSPYEQRYVQFPRMGELSFNGVELVRIPEQYHSWKAVQ
jgi:hypothetical protein